MFQWRFIPADYLDHLKSRVQELERQNGELLDRLLLGAGAMPVQPENRAAVERSERAVNSVLRELVNDEAGKDPDDEVGEPEPLEVESEA